MRNNVAIITSGFLPVPATKGGAVENLIMNTINENEKYDKINFTVFSIYDYEAENKSLCYNNTFFKFYKCPKIINFLDYLIYIVAKNILKKRNSQSFRNILRRLSYLNFTSKKLKKEKYDLIILENHPTQYLALKWRKNYVKYNGKFVYHSHNELPGYFGCENIMKKTKMIVSVSEFINKKMKETVKSEECSFKVLRNGIDSAKFKSSLSIKEKDVLRNKYNIKKDDLVFIYTGRIVPEKGVLELIKALQAIKKQNNYKLLIVGAPLNALQTKTKYQEKIEKEIEKISSNVIFTGFIKYDEMPQMYKISDIAIMPSIWDDPAPLSIIEALCCGLPIITTDSGGITEYANNKCAIFNNRDDNLINNLTKSINRLIEDEEKRKNMSLEALKCSNDLNLERYYNDFIEIIEELLKK